MAEVLKKNSKLIGITGGLGAGKSSVVKLLKAKGWGAIDADQIAREVVKPNTVGFQKIFQAFGQDALTAEGEINRRWLRTKISQDARAKALLEGILHPLIKAESLRLSQELFNAGHEFVAYEASLLLESGRKTDFAAVVGVSAPDDVRIARVAARDSVTQAAAEELMQTQMPQAAKLALCDYVIKNEGDLKALEPEINKFIAWAKTNARAL